MAKQKHSDRNRLLSVLTELAQRKIENTVLRTPSFIVLGDTYIVNKSTSVWALRAVFCTVASTE